METEHMSFGVQIPFLVYRRVLYILSSLDILTTEFFKISIDGHDFWISPVLTSARSVIRVHDLCFDNGTGVEGLFSL